jgi:hypothetical protein
MEMENDSQEDTTFSPKVKEKTLDFSLDWHTALLSHLADL